MQKRHFWLYVLELEDGKWYVGITSKTPEIRFEEHVRGYYAAGWTKKYRPRKVVHTEDLGVISKAEAEEIEHRRTKELMREYGWENVRGGRFRSLDYKMRYGVLWRLNTENDMPTIDTLNALHAVAVMAFVLLLLGVLSFL